VGEVFSYWISFAFKTVARCLQHHRLFKKSKTQHEFREKVSHSRIIPLVTL